MPSEMEKRYTDYKLDTLQSGKRYIGCIFDVARNGETLYVHTWGPPKWRENILVEYLKALQKEEKVLRLYIDASRNGEKVFSR